MVAVLYLVSTGKFSPTQMQKLSKNSKKILPPFFIINYSNLQHHNKKTWKRQAKNARQNWEKG